MSKKGSLTHQIAQMEIDVHKMSKSGIIATSSFKQYKDHAIKFGRWCKDHHGCKTPEECKQYIQVYADWLKAEGKTASTIHTYLAAVCRWWDVPLEDIKGRPIRYTSENTRSRGTKKSDARKDTKREASPRLYDFAECVASRRAEYKRLRGYDFIYDESGYPCVFIRRGKGGKPQLQRLLPEDVEFVKSYFDGNDDDLVFSPDEMRNKIDLHHLRDLLAQRAYVYYNTRVETEPGYAEQLAKEIEARWKHLNSRPWDPKCLKGYYYLRGKNREFALANGLTTKYSRLALMAISVFHLSHWRADVTVANYLLAI